MDAHKNLAVSTVATAPSPAPSGTSLVVAAGHGARFPAAPFNATVWPSGSLPDPSNAEIVRVTAVVSDTLTITRAQESTSARSIVVGDLIAATVTAKTLTDVEDAIANHLADTSDAHDASAVSFTPAGNVAATDVQAAITELDSEKAAVSHVHAGEDITSGTVADARIASTIARDSEVTAAISASEAGQVRDGDAAGGVLSGTYPNPGFAADMATQAELDAHVNDAADAHAASAIMNTPAGSIAATTVQAAINELDTEKQPLDSDLTIIAGLSPTNDDVIQRKAGAWTNRTLAQLLADLAAAGTTFQPLDSDLTAIAALSTTNFGRGLLALADAAAARATLDVWQGFTTSIVKSADQSQTANTTLTDDNELVLAISSSPTEIWFVEMFLRVGAANAAMDIKTGWTVPSGATIDWGTRYGSSNTPSWGGEPTSVTKNALRTESDTQSYGTSNPAPNQRVLGYGISAWVYGGGTAGNVVFRWSQDTSDAGALVVKKGSLLRATKLVA